MHIAITIAAAPRSHELLLDAAAALQRDLNGELKFDWLGEGEAIDLILPAGKAPSPQPSPARGEGASRGRCEGVPSPLAGEGQDEGSLSELKQLAAGAVANRPLDWCVQPADSRKKRMLIADMDSTIIGQECLDEMADFKGIKPEIAALTERAMRGELDFEAALHERIRLLAGIIPADLQHVLDEHITLNPGARTLVQTMKARGAHTVLVSGGFTFFTRAVAARAGFAKDRANIFLWEGGHLSGVGEPILGREAKLAALKEEAAAHGLALSEVIAVGDGANDLAMLKAAGLGVAYRAKPVVAAEADAEVKHTDLTALLYFQGYTRDSFVL
jgi:phosphoserine phosphatase